MGTAQQETVKASSAEEFYFLGVLVLVGNNGNTTGKIKEQKPFNR